MSKVKITDTILRDAHQCLIATRMRTEDMLPACEKLDAVGYWSLEAWGGATFDACVPFSQRRSMGKVTAITQGTSKYAYPDVVAWTKSSGLSPLLR